MKEEVSRKTREILIEQARQMRAEPTPAEELIWKKLRKRQLDGIKFRRQHIIEQFIVDFYCPKAKLVIEIDGPVHLGQKEHDQEREKLLTEMDYQVVRFNNAEIKNHIDQVMAAIHNLCKERIG